MPADMNVLQISSILHELQGDYKNRYRYGFKIDEHWAKIASHNGDAILLRNKTYYAQEVRFGQLWYRCHIGHPILLQIVMS